MYDSMMANNHKEEIEEYSLGEISENEESHIEDEEADDYDDDDYEDDEIEEIEEYTEIYEIGSPSWEYLKGMVAPDHLKFTSHEMVERQRVYMFASETDYYLTGYVFLVPKLGDKTAYCLNHILVVVENRLDGLGSRLLEHAEKTLRQRKIKRIETFCLEDEEKEATAFLEKNGFNRCGERTVLTYDLQQLLDSSVHKKDIDLKNRVVPICNLTKDEESELYDRLGINVRGVNRNISAALILDGRICGYSVLNLSRGRLCMESMNVAKDADYKMAYLQLWKYTVDKMIEISGEKKIREISVRVDAYADALDKLIGKPKYSEVIPLFEKIL